jgi:hypothetical protein
MTSFVVWNDLAVSTWRENIIVTVDSLGTVVEYVIPFVVNTGNARFNNNIVWWDDWKEWLYVLGQNAVWRTNNLRDWERVWVISDYAKTCSMSIVNDDLFVATRGTYGQVLRRPADPIITAQLAMANAMLLAPTAGNPAVGSVGAQIDALPSAADIVAAIDADPPAVTVDQQEVRDAMLLAPTAGDPAVGSLDKKLNDVLEDTSTTLPTALSDLPTDIDTWLTAEHGAGLWTNSTGAGDIMFPYLVTDAGLNPVVGAKVIVTTDIEGNNRVAMDYTDEFGYARFHLTAGSYYFWTYRAGYQVSRSDAEVIA